MRENNKPYYVVSGNEKQVRLGDAVSIVNQMGSEELEIKKQGLENVFSEYFG